MTETKLFKTPVLPKTGDKVISGPELGRQFQGCVCASFQTAAGWFVVVELTNTRSVFCVAKLSEVRRVTEDFINRESRIEPYTELAP